MNILNIFKKTKNQEIRADTPVSETMDFLSLLGITGELTRDATAEIPTVSACINKISDTISRLPIKLYKKSGNQVQEISDDHRLKFLNGDTGDTLNSVEMIKACISDYFLGGGGWIYANKTGLKLKSLHYVSDKNISFLPNSDPIFKAYKVMINGVQYFDFQFIKILRKTVDGYTNIPLQKENATILSAAYNTLKLENSIAQKGGCKSGFLKSKNRLSKEAIADIKSGYARIYDNSSNNAKVIVLNDGIEFQEISSTSVEMQMNENKKTNSAEICKVFGFPHTVIDGGATAEDIKAFIQAVIALINQIETALDSCLLLESEKNQGYYFAFDTKEITRGSMLERYQAYDIALKNRILQVDEVRKEEDYDPIGFNFVTLGLGDVLIDPNTKQIYTPNTNKIADLNLKGGETNEN